MIEQENKDKMLIHEKLIQAEREKELLEIDVFYLFKKNHHKQQARQKKV